MLHGEAGDRSDAVLASSPTTMTWLIPFCFSRKSRSLLAKPLSVREAACSARGQNLAICRGIRKGSAAGATKAARGIDDAIVPASSSPKTGASRETLVTAGGCETFGEDGRAILDGFVAALPHPPGREHDQGRERSARARGGVPARGQDFGRGGARAQAARARHRGR